MGEKLRSEFAPLLEYTMTFSWTFELSGDKHARSFAGGVNCKYVDIFTLT